MPIEPSLKLRQYKKKDGHRKTNTNAHPFKLDNDNEEQNMVHGLVQSNLNYRFHVLVFCCFFFFNSFDVREEAAFDQWVIAASMYHIMYVCDRS